MQGAAERIRRAHGWFMFGAKRQLWTAVGSEAPHRFGLRNPSRQGNREWEEWEGKLRFAESLQSKAVSRPTAFATAVQSVCGPLR
jgi:hypothetical protein